MMAALLLALNDDLEEGILLLLLLLDEVISECNDPSTSTYIHISFFDTAKVQFFKNTYKFEIRVLD